MKPFAFTRSCTLVSISITAGSDQASGSPSKTFWKTSGPPMPVEEELQPHHVGPAGLAAERERRDAWLR